LSDIDLEARPSSEHELLEGRKQMKEAATEMPPVKGGMNAYIEVDGALRASQFYQKAFAAEEVYVVPPDEKGRTMHVHLYVNGSSLMLSDPYPEHGHPHQKAQGYTLQLHLQEHEIDAWWKRAIDAGCEVATPLELMFWGDRWGSLRDPFGVSWAMNAPARS
jgi:PhnB protein